MYEADFQYYQDALNDPRLDSARELCRRTSGCKAINKDQICEKRCKAHPDWLKRFDTPGGTR